MLLTIKIKSMNLSRSANWYTALSLESGPAQEVLDILIEKLEEFIEDIYVCFYVKIMSDNNVFLILKGFSSGNLLRYVSTDYSLLKKGVGGNLVVYKVVLGIYLINLLKIVRIIWNNIYELDKLYGVLKSANLYLLKDKLKKNEK